MTTSATISAKMVSDLRARTGAGLMDCKKALVETNGDIEQAMDLLRKKGIASAAKKSGRSADEGTIYSYIHMGGRVGVMLELNCETDFVAKNDAFKEIAKDICMHIAAASPLYVSREEIPEAVVQKEKDLAAEQAEGKPPAAIEKIVTGKVEKFYEQACLLDQVFVKDGETKIKDLISEKIAQLGENIVIGRFTRYALGE